MKIKFVADSSANLLSMENVDFTNVPIIVTTMAREFIDNEQLNVENMLAYLREYKGKTGSACPGIGEWLNAFEGADIVYGTTVTSGLSGSYNAALNAAEMYMEEHPGAKVYIQDSLSAGPEPAMIMEKFVELVNAGFDYEEVYSRMMAYVRSTRLGFTLSSIDNFAKNGRVNPAVAKIVNVLNIHIVGKASESGELEPTDKCRGFNASLKQLMKNMVKEGYAGGRVRIHHTQNAEGAEKFAELLRGEFPLADIKVGANRGLCSYYAEEGSLLVGYEV